MHWLFRVGKWQMEDGKWQIPFLRWEIPSARPGSKKLHRQRFSQTARLSA
jgi:hypothetical protein